MIQVNNFQKYNHLPRAGGFDDQSVLFHNALKALEEIKNDGSLIVNKQKK